MATDFLEHEAEIEESEAEPTMGLGNRDTEEIRRRELRPRVTVERVVGALHGLEVLERHAVAEDLTHESRQFLLRLGEREIHAVASFVFSVISCGLPGMFSPKMAMRSRCISLVPPPKVRMCIERSMPRADRAAPRRASRRAGWPRAEDLDQQPHGLDVELGAVHLDGRGVGRVQRRATLPIHATRQLASLGTRAARAPAPG